jgi:transcriptional regulator with XRE-family HTH domain
LKIWQRNQYRQKYKEVPQEARFVARGPCTLTKIENNVIKKPSVLTMAKLAKAFGVSIEDLIK